MAPIPLVVAYLALPLTTVLIQCAWGRGLQCFAGTCPG